MIVIYCQHSVFNSAQAATSMAVKWNECGGAKNCSGNKTSQSHCGYDVHVYLYTVYDLVPSLLAIAEDNVHLYLQMTAVQSTPKGVISKCYKENF